MGNTQDIQRLYNSLNNDIMLILKSITQMIYFMRGGISYEHALYGMSFIEREIATDFISQRLKEEIKSPHPVY